MQFSENWLRQFVNPKLNTLGLSDALTMAGLEVEDCQPVAADFSQVVIAEIISADKHTDADRLQVCTVNIGAETLQIVCGAANARVGIKVPCALVGAALPSIAIKQAKVRGVESFGMLCSEKELGLAADSMGLLELPLDAPVGMDIREYLDLNDHSMTIKLTPNRADCLSIIGIARDVAAITGAPLNSAEIKAVTVDGSAQKAVRVIEPKHCPRYAGRLITGVNAQVATPTWMMRSLNRSGIRSISAIVDITNYVLLEMGQPLHAFDASKLTGDIQVRFAKEGEKLTLLNDQAIALKVDDLVIADDNGAVALAGIMGGEPTSVTEATSDIFLESAFFTPAIIAGKARRLGLSTDSSYRFERGVDFGNTRNALERATQLVLEICGGTVNAVTEVIADLPKRQPVTMRLSRCISVLGIHFTTTEISQIFTQLGFDFAESNDVFSVNPPSYRFDIVREEDLIEEVVRLHGFDKLPATPPTAALTMLNASELALKPNLLQYAMVAQGYQEAVTYSFVDKAWERDLMGNTSPIVVKNPIASNMSVMRTTLWGGLLDALQYNLNRNQTRVRLFEIGASYIKSDSGFSETLKISGVAFGASQPEQWSEASRDVDFYDVKATIDVLTNHQASYEKGEHTALHPGQTALVKLHGNVIGFIGTLHPKLKQQYGLTKNAVLFELDAAPLLKRSVMQSQDLPKTLPVRRDIAVIVDDNITVGELLDSAKKAEIPFVVSLELFDIYRGQGIANTKKSLAFLILMQDTNKTLLDSEADGAVSKLLTLWQQKYQVQLR